MIVLSVEKAFCRINGEWEKHMEKDTSPLCEIEFSRYGVQFSRIVQK
jgi:hypothetical protein